MKKIFLLIIFVCMSIYGLIFYGLKMNPLSWERKVSYILMRDSNNQLIQSRVNSNALMSYTSQNNQGEIETITGTAFDMKYDILFHQDANVDNIDYSNLTGGWQLFTIPDSDNIEIGVSVCKLGFFNCDTTYYKNISCLKLIYIPRFYNRKRDDILSGCVIVDISTQDRDSLWFSVK